MRRRSASPDADTETGDTQLTPEGNPEASSPVADPVETDDTPPSAEEIAEAILLLRARKQPAQPTPQPSAVLPDAKDVDTSKLRDKVLTKQGWLLPEAAQVQANG